MNLLDQKIKKLQKKKKKICNAKFAYGVPSWTNNYSEVPWTIFMGMACSINFIF